MGEPDTPAALDHGSPASVPARRVDARGQLCPLPILLLARAVAGVEPGVLVELLGTDPAIPADLRTWCARTGHALVEVVTAADGSLRARICVVAPASAAPSSRPRP